MKKWEFPSKIGSYNEYSQPALEFAKQICVNIFGLDEAFSTEATILKKNLLKLVHEKEFSPQVVQGIEPSLVLVVPDVICEGCQSSTDLDICRDPYLNYEEENMKGDWKCRSCETPLNKGLIERRLVELVNRRVAGY